MNIHLLYVGVDAAAITLMLLVAARVFQLAPRGKNTWLIAIVVLGAISYIVSARQDYGALIPDPFDADFGSFFPFLNLMRNSTTAFFMLLCHSIFRDGSSAPKSLLTLLAVQLFLEEPLAWIVGPSWAIANPTISFALYEVVPSIIMVSFLGFALYWILKERRVDLVESRRKVRVLILFVYIMQVVLSLVVERVAMSLDVIPWIAQYPIHVAIVAIGAMTSLAILFSLTSPDSAQFIDPPPPIEPELASDDTSTTDPELSRIKDALESDRIYHTAGLGIGDFARHLSLPEYRLRALIHHHMGFRNFNALLHHYRVGEVSEALGDAAQNATPILTLALSAGYQSINPFNRAFRELKGMTPTEYRRQIQKNNTESLNSTPNSSADA